MFIVVYNVPPVLRILPVSSILLITTAGLDYEGVIKSYASEYPNEIAYRLYNTTSILVYIYVIRVM